MRYFVTILTLTLALSSVSAYAGTEVLEDFNSYPVGFFDYSHNYYAVGSELVDKYIWGDNNNNFLQIDFNSRVGQGSPWVSFGLVQKHPFSTPRDLRGGTLSFDIKTNIFQTWETVLTPEITVLSQENFNRFRLSNKGLIDLPMTSEWTTVNIDVNDLIYNEFGYNLQIPDFSNVIGLNILALQISTDIIDTGTVSIDNIRWSGPNVPPVPEPGAMMLCAFGGFIALIRKKLRK